MKWQSVSGKAALVWFGVVWATRRTAVLKLLLAAALDHGSSTNTHRCAYLQLSGTVPYAPSKLVEARSLQCLMRCSKVMLRWRFDHAHRQRPKRPCPSSCKIRGATLVTRITIVLRSTVWWVLFTFILGPHSSARKDKQHLGRAYTQVKSWLV